MKVYQLRPASNPDGTSAAAWFDDEACSWNDDRLDSPATLVDDWDAPLLELHRPEAGATAVLFNPNALAVSEDVRASLASFPELEFLPVHIKSHGLFHVLHVTAAVELPTGARARINAVSKNIVQIDALPQAFEPGSASFRILQPVGSAAREAASCIRAVYLNDKGAHAIEASGEGYLVASELPSD